MANYKIGEKDILGVSKQLGITLTNEQVTTALELYYEKRAIMHCRWDELIEHVITNLI